MEITLCSFPVGKSALHWAAAVNNVEATLVLLKNGANRDMQDNKVSSNAVMNADSNCACLLVLMISVLLQGQCPWIQNNENCCH